VSKDVFADVEAVGSGRQNDRAISRVGLLKGDMVSGTLVSRGCSPLKVLVDFCELLLCDPSDGRFLEFCDGIGGHGLASTRRRTADLVGEGGVK
jgi:hypothetical protein